MISKPKNRDIVVGALKHAAPYIRMYKKKIFVIKAGGEVFESRESTNKLVEQISILHQVGIRIVVIHGGGPQSTRLAGALGIETNMIDGRRVTNAETLKVSTMILNGEINTQILAACRDLDVPAVGEHGRAEIPRRIGRYDPSLESLFHEVGDVPAVIDMGVREDAGVDLCRHKVECRVPLEEILPPSLEQAAVDDDL